MEAEPAAKEALRDALSTLEHIDYCPHKDPESLEGCTRPECMNGCIVDRKARWQRALDER